METVKELIFKALVGFTSIIIMVLIGAVIGVSSIAAVAITLTALVGSLIVAAFVLLFAHFLL